MTHFKLKRPHAPDNIGAENYKRIKLIEDFTNLSISPYNNHKDVATPPITKLLRAGINIPTSLKDKLLTGRLQLELCDSTDEIINYKILKWIKDYSSQIVKYVNWKYMTYLLWCKWYQSNVSDYEMISDVDMNDACNNDYKRVENIVHRNAFSDDEIADERLDVDMDS